MQARRLPSGEGYMARIKTAYDVSDSWILLALVYGASEQPADLQQIIKVADGINHAIPTAEELDGALNRLLAAGFVVGVAAGFLATPLAANFVSRVSTPRKPVLDVWDDLNKLLA